MDFIYFEDYILGQSNKLPKAGFAVTFVNEHEYLYPTNNRRNVDFITSGVRAGILKRYHSLMGSFVSSRSLCCDGPMFGSFRLVMPYTYIIEDRACNIYFKLGAARTLRRAHFFGRGIYPVGSSVRGFLEREVILGIYWHVY